ncbi:MAG: response regulator [Candidatus Lernaella stagnicola]|nr:response regulator [Candidatus Lernaella stagnicola]
MTNSSPVSENDDSRFDGVRVLVVEDNRPNQIVAARLLAGLGCAVDLADDGLSAVEMLRETRYDIVLMDIHMPKLDGFATTRTIRHMEGEGMHVPIVAMTAHVVAGMRERCLAAGVDDFVAKPISMSSLRRVLPKRNE